MDISHRRTIWLIGWVSVDDKMLLAAVVLILTAAYCGSLFGQAAVLRNRVVILVVYVAFRVWHNKQCDRFSVLGVDTTVSRRRVCMADRLFGIVWVFELLVWWLSQTVKLVTARL